MTPKEHKRAISRAWRALQNARAAVWATIRDDRTRWCDAYAQAPEDVRNAYKSAHLAFTAAQMAACDDGRAYFAEGTLYFRVRGTRICEPFGPAEMEAA